MEPKLLTVVETEDYRELHPDDMNVVAGGHAKTTHYQIAGVSLTMYCDEYRATWSVWGGREQSYEYPSM